MAGFQIRPLHEGDLPEIARWLAGQSPEGDGAMAPAIADPQVLEQSLRWRLIANPAARQGMEIGQGLRDAEGRLVGTHLAIPAEFASGDVRLFGLCSSSFYVGPEARMQGFLAFRRFLGLPDVDLWFAVTCNAHSGSLWSRLGGKAVPGSEFEHLFVCRAGPLVEELALRRGWGRVAAACAAAGARALDPSWSRRPRHGSWRLEPCRDWERLAWIAQRCRPPTRITPVRSAPSLSWRYDAGPSSQTVEVVRLEGPAGQQGWASLARIRRGRRLQIETWTLLDLVWPFDVGADGPLAAIVEGFFDRGDVVVLRGLAPARLSSLRSRQRSFEAPLAYVIGSGGRSQQLASAVQLMPSEGDAAP